mmetsp:Transcript_14989/g.33428  ORF Transcript_14989/g.33428 Transcript_14989/m.33428 type:complete len:342 (-) Transcript_14989:1080-2105(-)
MLSSNGEVEKGNEDEDENSRKKKQGERKPLPLDLRPIQTEIIPWKLFKASCDDIQKDILIPCFPLPKYTELNLQGIKHTISYYRDDNTSITFSSDLLNLIRPVPPPLPLSYFSSNGDTSSSSDQASLLSWPNSLHSPVDHAVLHPIFSYHSCGARGDGRLHNQSVRYLSDALTRTLGLERLHGRLRHSTLEVYGSALSELCLHGNSDVDLSLTVPELEKAKEVFMTIRNQAVETQVTARNNSSSNQQEEGLESLTRNNVDDDGFQKVNFPSQKKKVKKVGGKNASSAFGDDFFKRVKRLAFWMQATLDRHPYFVDVQELLKWKSLHRQCLGQGFRWLGGKC